MKQNKTGIFKKAIGFIIVLFALYTLSSGLALAGISTNLFRDAGKSATQVGSEQVINMTVNYLGYSPNVFTLQKGVPVKWVITVEQLTGCNNTVIVPAYNIRKSLVVGENIIQFTPTQEGTIGFSCAMGMIRGKFNVVGDGASPSSLVPPSANDSTLGSAGGCGCGGGGAAGATGAVPSCHGAGVTNSTVTSGATSSCGAGGGCGGGCGGAKVIN